MSNEFRDASVLLRFYSKFACGDPMECWDWKAGTGKNGYGRFRINGKQTLNAHKFAWMVENQREPNTGNVIMHSCDNVLCVNPDHLSEGTIKENGLDMKAKGRHPRRSIVHCPKGHEYTIENTRIKTDGSRDCKACQKIRNDKRKLR